jgi:polyisoprenoid-binding protein YceI
MKRVLTIAALATLAACSPPAAEKAEAPAAPAAITPMKLDAPSGQYKLDKMHASLIFKVDHIGFSWYTSRFSKWDATIQLDTADPTKSTVEATIDPNSLGLENPPPGFTDTVKGKAYLDVKTYPQMSFKSTKVELTGPNTAKITGDFTMHGVTKPVTLDATLNGGYPGMAVYDPQARIGLSAKGTLKRSDFGITTGIPEAGTKMGVSDEVQFIIEAEFNGPPMPAPAAAPAAPAP